MLSVVDLFAGVGGLSEGFAGARQNGKPMYDLRLLVDSDPAAALTYRSNRPEIRYLVDDIINISSLEVIARARIRDQSLDVLIGGPPCQGFSVLRRNRALDDPRNHMMQVFLWFAKAIRPRLFMIENVPNLLVAAGGKFWQEIRDYMGPNYVVKADVLNAYDYGVPQWRKRSFVVGIRNDVGITDFSF